MGGRLAPVQGDYRRKANVHPRLPPDGWIDWAEHLEVFEYYAKHFGRMQSAESIAARCGFSYHEIVQLTGKSPQTWRPRNG